MATPLSYSDTGYSDANRDTTASIESALRQRLGSEEIVCTYDGFGKSVLVYLGDELDPRKRELMLGFRYAIGVEIDIASVAESVVEAARAALHRRNVPSPQKPARA